MTSDVLNQLRLSLASSNAADRAIWAQQIAEQRIPLESLLPLFHQDDKTAERFTWLITDIGEQDLNAVASSIEILFSMRDQMPFPGMGRSVAKWLWMTGVPADIEHQAFDVLFEWLICPATSISCKTFSAYALYDAALQGRVSHQNLCDALTSQSEFGTAAYRLRIQKLYAKLDNNPIDPSAE